MNPETPEEYVARMDALAVERAARRRAAFARLDGLAAPNDWDTCTCCGEPATHRGLFVLGAATGEAHDDHAARGHSQFAAELERTGWCDAPACRSDRYLSVYVPMPEGWTP